MLPVSYPALTVFISSWRARPLQLACPLDCTLHTHHPPKIASFALADTAHLRALHTHALCEIAPPLLRCHACILCHCSVRLRSWKGCSLTSSARTLRCASRRIASQLWIAMCTTPSPSPSPSPSLSPSLLSFPFPFPFHSLSLPPSLCKRPWPWYSPPLPVPSLTSRVTSRVLCYVRACDLFLFHTRSSSLPLLTPTRSLTYCLFAPSCPS
ncbi:hypothetical protein GQ44DRAFT_702222 [Phaeosphaeriaceae sp. PMI808]|nr:hypothetical protein GQ44DRAFT_702222 [Phaeosphaeriaceae sp. PMI808]